ncbi:MAG: RNA polymerase sigma factor, partial [Nonomuraea sp.]|nr:RNA polymerase sigma factor [Nonomuraea sp.]
MPRTAVATQPASLDQLIERGRAQGHLSLAELRDAFAEAGISPSEGRTILRELSEAGVSLAAENEPSLGKTAAKKTTQKSAPKPRKASGAKVTGRKPSEAKAPADGKPEHEEDVAPDDIELTAEDAEIETESMDLDDTQSVMGDSVHTYLKSIGRRTLLTAAQEVELARRIEAGLYAEYKLEIDPDVTPAAREDLHMVVEDGRQAKDHMLEANLRLVVSVAK